jgi:hypothetical protein
MMDLTAKLCFTNGARSFPLLAGSDHDAGDRGPAFRAAAQRVRDTREGLRASLTALEACNLPAPVAQALFKPSACSVPESTFAISRRIRNFTRRSSSEAPSSASCPPDRIPRRRTFQCETESLLVCPFGVVIVEGKEHSGSLITARLAMEFGRLVFGVPGTATRRQLCPQPVDQAGSQTGHQRRVRDRESFQTAVRAALVPAEVVGSEERNSLMENRLTLT